jgi:hypothetical protein
MVGFVLVSVGTFWCIMGAFRNSSAPTIHYTLEFDLTSSRSANIALLTIY